MRCGGEVIKKSLNPLCINCNRRIVQKLTIRIYVGAKQEDLGPKIIKCNILLNREDKVDVIILSKSNNKRGSH